MTQRADCILHNAKVITCDARSTIARAVAIAGDRILGVGENADLAAYEGDATRRIDLQGRTVIPGLIDGHAHMDREGLKDVYPSLAGARSIDEVLQRVEALVKEAEPGAWIVTMPLGDPPYYWDVPNNLKEKRFPTRHDLDRVSPHNPVYVRSIWGFWRHTLPLVSVANSKALEIAGVTRRSLPPCGSVQIDKDFATGEPSGLFLEWTYMPVVELTLMRAAGAFTHEHRVRGLPKAMQSYNAVGTTSVFEEHGVASELLRAYKAVWEAGDATVRANLVVSPAWNTVDAVPANRLMESWVSWLAGIGLGDSFLRVGGLYAELQGAIGDPAENAARAQASPYTGWSGFNYDANLPREQLHAVMLEAARNDIRIVGLWPGMLELCEAVNRVVPIAGKRWALGHINVLTDDDIRRIKELDIVLTTHTNRYVFKEAHLTRDRVGPSGEHDIVPLRSLKEAGVRFALATDNVPVSLFHPIWHCVARRNRYTAEPVAPQQAISREDALRAATIEGAYLTFDEHEKGSIEPGKLADLAVLAVDPLTCDEGSLPDIVADMTIVGGRVVHDARGGPA
ncbi:MAG: amidohydrolase [Gammaproteobacteria bacterium]|nr:amidohydrolase [Gammaproteobacteria bacterium]NIR84402.1 amidohydrolase [Gammaproteobacteria bacterium]NIR90883.1 amidohydrolase [Gammaproteobacteria bacterium]NIU07069.1 amidohydrolase [Gammaproteobacteria bacterium]NIV76198.1 amidohydrolase family protein [Gammaproteobacteria bacterium]